MQTLLSLQVREFRYHWIHYGPRSESRIRRFWWVITKYLNAWWLTSQLKLKVIFTTKMGIKWNGWVRWHRLTTKGQNVSWTNIMVIVSSRGRITRSRWRFYVSLNSTGSIVIRFYPTSFKNLIFQEYARRNVALKLLEIFQNYGNQTSGENIADTMGLQTVFRAYKRRERVCKKEDPALPGLERFSNDQLFFLSSANVSLCLPHFPNHNQFKFKSVLLHTLRTYVFFFFFGK